jgi:alpha-tubulin suppressor-like RCC1 family protein
LTSWQSFSGGTYNSAAIKTDGTLWTCGHNVSGSLGLSDLLDRSSMTQVGTSNTWKSVNNTGNYWTTAIQTNGSLWSWGQNGQGQLGLGDVLVDRSSPVQVGSLTNWALTVNGYSSSYALKTDGSLWSWGFNTAGQLGLGNTLIRSSPTVIGSSVIWVNMAANFKSFAAIRNDGTLWICGDNTYGQLGLGDINSRSSLVQVGSLSSWRQINGGGTGNTFSAIKTDGSLWTWGLNDAGQLGLGDINSRSSPVQVGSLTNWASVSNGSRHVATQKTDGTLWTWGLNTVGQLGLGDVLSRSSPVQVGSLTNWKTVSGQYVTTFAIVQGTDF